MSGYFALLAALLLAGAGTAGCTPEPAASAAEPQANVQPAAVQQANVQPAAVQQAAVQQAAVQQSAGGQIVFSCHLGGGKIVTVKQDGGRFLYRYGTAGKAELTIEGTARNGRVFQKVGLHGGAYDSELRFVSGAYSYIVHSFPRSDIVDNDPRSGLIVLRGSKKIMDRDCSPLAEISAENYEELYALPEIPEGAPSAWGE